MSRDDLGHRLRAVRRARGYTLSEVAQRCGMSKSFLSMLETGKSDVSAHRLQRLAAVYDLTVSDLLPDERSRGLIHTVRRGAGARLQGFAEGVAATLLVRDLHHRIQPVRLRLEPGSQHANTTGHAGEEFLFVLEGSIELSLDGCPFEELQAGDSAFYPSALAHVYRNSSDAPAELLTISAPNTWFHA